MTLPTSWLAVVTATVPKAKKALCLDSVDGLDNSDGSGGAGSVLLAVRVTLGR